ncbi:MAG: sensor histidine kinase [Phycisphaerales bacterium JB063]
MQDSEATASAAIESSPPGGGAVSASDLAGIIEAYNGLTEKMQASHERLQGEVVRLRRELTSANAQLQRSKRLSALGEMAAGIAHEIRNPLAAIQLYVSMVVEDLACPVPQAGEALENARKIASAVQGMSAIVNDVLSFARGIEPDRRPSCVAELFDHAVTAHQPAIQATEVHVVRRDLARGPVEILADSGLMQQAILNLVRNAVDAMAQSESPRRLVLDVEPDELGYVLVVADSGPGIDDDRIDRIFNPFFTTRSTGTGLGLAIVHRIVDAHGGSVSVSNDNGAVFRLALPQTPAEHEHRNDSPSAADRAALTAGAAA